MKPEPETRVLRKLRLESVCVLLLVVVLSYSASANDGGIAMGGTPRLLKGHPSVSMRSEVVKISVQDKIIMVDCRFDFVNHGPACSVRMGFPDQGEDASDPDEEDADAMKHPPKTTFLSFHSYVDGKPVKTSLIRAHEEGQYWHTKTVLFPAHSTLHVRDVYTQHVGGGVASIHGKSGFAAQIAYTLHTGASWHGPIGRSEIVVTFQGSTIHGTPRPMPYRSIASPKPGSGMDITLASPPPDLVVWNGPCAPTVKGRTLRFVRRNWRPTKQDDIKLTYGYTFYTDQGQPATGAN